jgi:hypothetical protein
VIAALLQALEGGNVPLPVPVITTVGGAAGHQSYVVSATVNGQTVPSATVSTTTGPTTLGALTYNTVSWAALNIPQLQGSNFNVIYNVYRTAGGANQGLIGTVTQSVNSPAPLSFMDNGISANTTLTAPAFNTSGTPAASLQVVSTSVATITIPVGNVLITYAGAAAITLPAPVSGAQSAGGQDGCKLTFYTTTNNQHVITAPANTINGNKDTATMAATASSLLELVAYGGVWYSFSAFNVAVLTEV